MNDRDVLINFYKVCFNKFNSKRARKCDLSREIHANVLKNDTILECNKDTGAELQKRAENDAFVAELPALIQPKTRIGMF